MVKIPPHIKSLKAYKAGKNIDELAKEKKLKRIVKLASSENPLGPSPKALIALKNYTTENHRYVDPKTPLLTKAIAEHHNVDQSKVICGAGTDSLIAYMINCFSIVGDEILTAEGTFIGIYVNTTKHNRKLVTVPLQDYHFDLEGLLKHITDKTAIIYIANPNNPTGTICTRDQIVNFLDKVPDNILVILDEAYESFASFDPDYPDGLTLNYKNLIVTRTFSKVYGLAGVRAGYAIGPEELISELYKVRLPFEPSYPAQIAAIAALDDKEFVKQSVELNITSLTELRKTFDQIGIKWVGNHTNFIALIFATEQMAIDFTAACLDRGLIIRHVKAFGLPNAVRISNGTMDETKFAINVLQEVSILLGLCIDSTEITNNHQG